jgi:antitoxin (DNA-binding transcriptional repressor) of toxin-antitoxin stability system
MTVVNVLEAKTQFSQLLARAERGEEIVVARAGQPVVRLELVAGAGRSRRFGGEPFRLTLDDPFFEPIDEEELAAWE